MSCCYVHCVPYDKQVGALGVNEYVERYIFVGVGCWSLTYPSAGPSSIEWRY